MEQRATLPMLGGRLPELKVITPHGKMTLPDDLERSYSSLKVDRMD